ncbi:hypothetical protein ES703_53622 [subsurface metagenome]
MKKLVGVGVVVILALALVVSACADEVLEEIDYAREAYEEGSYSEAIEGFDFVIAQIRSLQVDELRKALPEPLSGWTMEEQERDPMGYGLFGLGSGLGVTRKYYKEDSGETIEISIGAQSIMLQQITMFLENPALAAAQPNTKLEKKRIAGKRITIVEEFSPEDESGKLSLTPDDKTLVTIEGWDISDKEILYEYLDGIDFDLMAEILK